MQRNTKQPRTDWQSKVEELGCTYHSIDDVAYWNESAAYSFNSREINAIEAVTNELEEMCIDALDIVISQDRMDQFAITDEAKELITDSWNNDEYNVYGRMDLSQDIHGNLKLLEYNADTPTSLLEASILQWNWLSEVMQGCADQFNSIHEKLVRAWSRNKIEHLHFTCMDAEEDIANTLYLQETAREAGIATEFLRIGDIGLKDNYFVDEHDRRIHSVFKLYPWEWLLEDSFGANIKNSQTRWFEPAWKMLLSNKAFMAVLWELNPNHPNLLKTTFKESDFAGSMYVKKPFLSREGANIEILEHRFNKRQIITPETRGTYGNNYIFQEFHQTISFYDHGKQVVPIIGSWVVASESAGIGIREDYGITTNLARFVPHFFN